MVKKSIRANFQINAALLTATATNSAQAAAAAAPGDDDPSPRAHLMGQGIEKNKGAAIRWLRNAACLGNNDAHVYLGLMLLYGDGVVENPAEAARRFRKSCRPQRPTCPT